MSFKFSKILLPTIVGVSVYLIINKLFPDHENNTDLERNPLKNLRGGDRLRLIRKITQHLCTDKALKLAIVSVFTTAGIQHFYSEIEALLIDDVVNQVCTRNVDGNLKIVCDIINENELNLHTKSIRSLIVHETLNRDQKISLLKIKLDFIINGQCGGKKRFLIMAIMAIMSLIFSLTFSGIGGLTIIMYTLHKLFQEGKISQALYEQILRRLTKRWGERPTYRSFVIELNPIIDYRV